MFRNLIMGGFASAILSCCMAFAQQQAPPQTSLKLHPAAEPDATQQQTSPAPAEEANAAPADAVADRPFAPGLSDYGGTLDGKRPVHFSLLVTPQGFVTGSYFLLSDLKELTFHGREIDANSFSAHVADANGPDASPYLYLKVDKSHSSGAWLSGALYGDGGANQHSVMVHLQSVHADVVAENQRYSAAGAADEASVDHNAQAFWQAVITNQPEQAAALVAYPLAYTENGKRTLLHTPAEFQAKFSAIFTPAYVAELKSLVPRAMTASAQGIMLGNGQIWFDSAGKAFAVNNEQVKMFAGKKFLTNAGWVRGASNGSSSGTNQMSTQGNGSATNDGKTSGQRSAQRRSRRRRSPQGG